MTHCGPRIALYSHDTVGLGHVRRNLKIATALTSADQSTSCLLLAGVHEVGAFAMPERVDCLGLPAFTKTNDGNYHPRSLALEPRELMQLRAQVICAALESFNPDVLIVDKVPLGVLRELEPGLKSLRKRGRTRFILGLRDVLDDPSTVAREFQQSRTTEAINEYYDSIWIYGDPDVYDPVFEYNLSSQLRSTIHFTGYLGQREPSATQCLGKRELLTALGLPVGRLALCLVGGGVDGFHLGATFAQALLPPGTNGLILTGPFMPFNAKQALDRMSARQPHVRVADFACVPEYLLELADNVVAMGGYNTICEVLSYKKRALIVPRVKPRLEQFIRAERMRDLGFLDLLHPDNLSPSAVSEWLFKKSEPPDVGRHKIDLSGLARIPRLLDEILSGQPV